jgi:hypothetical protein
MAQVTPRIPYAAIRTARLEWTPVKSWSGPSKKNVIPAMMTPKKIY